MSGSLCEHTLRAAIAGDQAAILTLMQAAQHDIRRYARRACRTPSDAEDAAQETLWVLYRHIGGLERIGAFSSWLFRIVTRTCQRLAQKVLPFVPLPDDETEHRLLQRPEAELRLDLANAIHSLPAHYRNVLLLRDVEELTIDEIAGALTLSRESVKARLHRARGLVREYLAH